MVACIVCVDASEWSLESGSRVVIYTGAWASKATCVAKAAAWQCTRNAINRYDRLGF